VKKFAAVLVALGILNHYYFANRAKKQVQEMIAGWNKQNDEEIDQWMKEGSLFDYPKRSFKMWPAQAYRWPLWLYEYFKPVNYWRVFKHRWQRMERGFSDRDTWSFDYHLAHMLVQALPYFKNDRNMVLFTTKEYMKFENYSEEEWKAAEQAGDALLDGMIEGFKILAYKSHWSYTEEDREKVDFALDNLAEYWGALWI